MLFTRTATEGRDSRDVVELVSAIIDVLQVGVHIGPADITIRESAHIDIRHDESQCTSTRCKTDGTATIDPWNALTQQSRREHV